jgi:hypothetical protein
MMAGDCRVSVIRITFDSSGINSLETQGAPRDNAIATEEFNGMPRIDRMPRPAQC